MFQNTKVGARHSACCVLHPSHTFLRRRWQCYAPADALRLDKMEERSKAFSIWQIDKNGGGTWSGISDATSQTKCSLCVIYKKFHAPLQWKTLIMSINLSLIGPTANTPRHHLISVHVQSVDPLWENAYRQSTRGDDEGDSFSTVCFVLTAMHFSEN